MSQLLAQNRKARKKQWPLYALANNSYFAEFFLNFEITCYIVVLNDDSVLFGFYTPRSNSACAVKTSAPFVSNQQRRIHLFSP